MSVSTANGRGSLGIGVARSTDVLAGDTFKGRAINSIVPTTLTNPTLGTTTVLAATWLDGGGVYRSIDSGVTFTRISGNGTSGLPNAGVTSLIADPGSANVVCDGAKPTGATTGTSPHPDSRFMAFDANGNLLQANDGGIARLVNPNTAATRNWVAVVGDIGSAEFPSIAYDPLSNIVFGGTQDNGTPIQSSPGEDSWNQVLTGDGGVVGIDANQISHAGTSLRYYSFQSFIRFTRSEWNASNTMQRSELVGLNITAVGTGMRLIQFDPNIEFRQPFVLNAIDPARMLIGTMNLYESINRGDSLTNLGSLGALVSNSQGYGRAMTYGSRLDGLPIADVFYVGAGATIFHRVTAAGAITKLASYPGGIVITIAKNPNNYKQVYVSDLNNKVWGSFDEGATWNDLTGNLPSLTGLVTTIEVFSPDATVGNTMLFAGGFGVFQLTNPSTIGGLWTPVTGPGDNKIPPALALDLHYDYTNKVLASGTLGRGAWLFRAPPAIPSARKLPSSTAAKNLPAPPPSVPNSQNVPLPQPSEQVTSLDSPRPRGGD